LDIFGFSTKGISGDLIGEVNIESFNLTVYDLGITCGVKNMWGCLISVLMFSLS
jgi:hypothetical protein